LVFAVSKDQSETLVLLGRQELAAIWGQKDRQDPLAHPLLACPVHQENAVRQVLWVLPALPDPLVRKVSVEKKVSVVSQVLLVLLVLLDLVGMLDYQVLMVRKVQ
jgi:hypothetical protein